MFWKPKGQKFCVGSKVVAWSGTYKGQRGVVKRLTKRMAYVKFGSGVARVMQTSLKVDDEDTSSDGSLDGDTIDEVDVILLGLVRLRLNDDEIHELIDCRLEALRESMMASQSSESEDYFESEE